MIHKARWWEGARRRLARATGGRPPARVATAVGGALAVALLAGGVAAWWAGRGDVSEACRRAAAMPGVTVGADELQRHVGRMIMVGMDGMRPGEGTVPQTRALIERGELGGILLLGRNLGSPAEIRALIADVAPPGAPVAPFVAVDQEGGRVQRLRETQGVATIPSAAKVAEMGEGAAAETYARAARELAAVGINVNFGPVVDLAVEPLNPVIVGLERSYGADPDVVTRLARTFIDAHREAGIAVALKHFPGHGSSLADSHEGFTDITRSWSPVELEPYRALAAEAEMVMTGHLYHAGLPGADGHPVTLAPGVIAAMLRDELGYDGVVVTDDLDMGAIAEHYAFDEAVRMAVNAGNDLLLFSAPTRPEGFVPALARDAICEGLAGGTIAFDRVEGAHARIERLAAARLGAGR